MVGRVTYSDAGIAIWPLIILIGGFMSTYCVICRNPEANSLPETSMIAFYLRSSTAAGAIVTIEAEHPECRVLGIERLAGRESRAA
jgi:hypothetical protein